MNKLFFTLIVLLVFILPAQSQNRLKGNVHEDESGTGLFLTTVRVLTQDSSFVNGGVADNNGSFEVKDIKAGKYILAVSNIGYISRYIDFKMPEEDYSLPLIILKTDIVSLNEVVVKGSTFIQKKDHLLVIPDKQQIKHAYTGYDLLYNLMIPGVDVNRRGGSVSTSRGAATLYINGVRVNYREVQNLRPKDIEKVEYFDMPTGNYLGDVASINYITKEYKTGGYISLDGEQSIGYLAGKYNVGAKIVDNNTGYTFFGGYNMKEYDGIAKEKNEELFFPDYTVNRNSSNQDANFSNNQQYAQFKVSNNTKKRSLFGLVSFVHDATPQNDRNQLLSYSGYNDQNIQSLEQVNQQSLKPALSLDGIFHPTESQRIHVIMNGSYTKNTYDRNYTEGKQLSVTNADEDLYSLSAVGIYTIQLKHKNSFGGNIQHYHNVTSSLYSGDYSSWQHLWMGETLLFLNYTQDFGDKVTLTVSPGGSLLNYKLHGNELQRFRTFRTNSWIRYRFNSKHSIVGGFAIGNGQAHLSYLNKIDQTVDFLQVKRGNPELGNLKIHDYFFTYDARISPINLQFNLWYSIYSNNISSDYYIEGNKLISSYRSNSSFHKLKAELLTSYRISDNLRANVKLKYEYMNVPKESNFSETNFTAAADVNYFLKSFTINAYAKTPERTLDNETFAFIKSPGTYGLSVCYNAKKWMAEIGTENPFTKHANYREYANYGVYKYNQIQTSRIYQQTAYIKLAYTFDFGKMTLREYDNAERSINSGILKTE